MSRRNSERITAPQLEIPTINVPCQFRDQAAAFTLGVHDAYSKTRIPRTFVIPASRTAYAAGVLAGVTARTLKLKPKGATNANQIR